MVAREIAVKKYVVKLSADEREQLESLIHGGKHPAQKLTAHPVEGGRLASRGGLE